MLTNNTIEAHAAAVTQLKKNQKPKKNPTIKQIVFMANQPLFSQATVSKLTSYQECDQIMCET